MSAESGLKTFRDSGGLWEGYDVMDVASIDGWHRNPAQVLEFYNLRRKQAYHAEPNAGHLALVELEKHFNVWIVTQNVDSLHEKAGSTQIVHLHGELSKVRSIADETAVTDIADGSIQLGDTGADGAQLRPHIVWFGEMVPEIERAAALVQHADIVIVIGTSLVVYPAAGLVGLAPEGTPIYLIDPSRPDIHFTDNITFLEKTAALGTPELISELIKQYSTV